MAGRPPTRQAPPFGQRLAATRKDRGWSQAELARRLDATRALIDYYERRACNPTMAFIRRAAEVLGVPVSALFDGASEAVPRRPGPPSRLEQQIEEIRRLPRTKQRFVCELLDTVLKSSA